MRRKLIGLILIASILGTCIGLIGCKSKDEKATVEDTTNVEECDSAAKEEETAEESKVTEEKNNNEVKDNETKKENKNNAENNLASKEKNKDNTEKDNSKSQSSKQEKNSTNKNSNQQKSEKKQGNLSKEQLVKSVVDKQSDFKSFNNITPVKATGQGSSLSYEHSNGSDLFFCSEKKFNSKKIDGGIVVNFMRSDKDNKGEYYDFTISDYELIKNGGKGTVCKGKVYKDGQVSVN